jgi:hypothetical protein
MDDSSPDDESGVARGDVTRAEVSDDLNRCVFLMSLGVLRARRIGSDDDLVCDCCACIKFGSSRTIAVFRYL